MPAIWIAATGIILAVLLFVVLAVIEVRRSFGILSRAQSIFSTEEKDADEDDWGFTADWI